MYTVIKRQLQRSNDAIVKRITSLLPWLNGKLTLRPGTVNPIAEEDEQANKAKDQDIDTTDSPAMYVVHCCDSPVDVFVCRRALFTDCLTVDWWCGA